MPPKRRSFQRPLGNRPYRKLFLIAAEGADTELGYFEIFRKDRRLLVRIECLKGEHRSSPPQILKRIKNRLQREDLKKSDEAWLVADKDNWKDEQLDQLHAWASEQDNRGFALSNPNFEYWLLLHFEKGDGIKSVQDCRRRLERRFPNYDKKVDVLKITTEDVKKAIRHAKNRDNPPCDWPRQLGCTTVYRLMENILASILPETDSGNS